MANPDGSLNSEKVLTLLKEIESNPQLTQRYLSKKLSVSLGKINFFIRALAGKGFIEINNFKESKNKLGYAYLLTPEGIRMKFNLIQQFLKWKTQEYERLEEEIAALKKEVAFIPQEIVAEHQKQVKIEVLSGKVQE